MRPEKVGIEAPMTRAVAAWMPLVQDVARQFLKKLPANVLRDDLVAAGAYGLMDALRRWNERDESMSGGYLRTRIRGAIYDELRAQDWLSRRTRVRVQKEIAAGTASDDIRSTVVGLDELGSDDVRAMDVSNHDPFTAVAERFEHAALAEAIAALPEREHMIVVEHYFEDTRIESVAKKLGVTQSRASQLHARALRLLRTALEAASA